MKYKKQKREVRETKLARRNEFMLKEKVLSKNTLKVDRTFGLIRNPLAK